MVLPRVHVQNASVPGGTLEQLEVAASHFDFGQSRNWAK
jgi:hypothetical protein